MDKKAQLNFWYIIIAIFGILLIQSMYSQYTKVEPIPTAAFTNCSTRARSRKSPSPESHLRFAQGERCGWNPGFRYHRVESDLAEQLDKHNVIYTGVVQSTWLRDLLSWILPMAIFIGIWLFLIRRMNQAGSPAD